MCVRKLTAPSGMDVWNSMSDEESFSISVGMGEIALNKSFLDHVSQKARWRDPSSEKKGRVLLHQAVRCGTLDLALC